MVQHVAAVASECDKYNLRICCLRFEMCPNPHNSVFSIHMITLFQLSAHCVMLFALDALALLLSDQLMFELVCQTKYVSAELARRTVERTRAVEHGVTDLCGFENRCPPIDHSDWERVLGRGACDADSRATARNIREKSGD